MWDYRANEQKEFMLVYDNINMHMIPKFYRGGAVSEEVTAFVRSILTPSNDFNYILIENIWSSQV